MDIKKMNRKGVFSLPSIATIAAASTIFIHWFLFRKRNIQSTPTDEITTHNNNNSEASSSTLDLEAPAGGIYEVFLSFCGKDTRKGFTDFLYTYLVGASIQTFRDNDELKVGEKIGPELLKAIKESKISIPIFSTNYVSSKWCLMELEHMVECHKKGGHNIYPIFYDVDPSDVRNQRGSYHNAFSEHQKKFDEGTVQRWREALRTVAELKGFELNKETDGCEGKLVKLIVEKVLLELKKNYTHVPENLVGMDKHVEKMLGLLEVDSDNVRIVGIHGMGGLGKTTIAKFIYNQLYEHFEGQCFLDNVRENSKHPDGILELQKQFISSIQNRGVSSVSNAYYGWNLIKDSARGKKLLLVLDDVDEYFQVETLMGDQSWFGAQSRIIVTTRDKNVLDEIELNCQNEDPCVVYRSYDPDFLDNGDSLQLFSKHAFKRDSPIEGYDILSKEVVSIAAGLPLVLVVLGSTFFLVKDQDLWEEKLRQLRKIPHKKVLEKLKFSFEALEHNEKQIFLDIACFFIGSHKSRPSYMWEDCGFYPRMGISVLVSRSLITVADDDVLRMHDQLRDLGRQIVREEGLHKLGEQSRLWCPKEGMQMLELRQGTSNVNAICLGSSSSIVASSHFHHLPYLRYLSMSKVNVEGNFKHLLPNLKWLECQRMRNFSPSNLKMKNLVVLRLSSCDFTYSWDGWSQLKMAINLKVLELYVELKILPNLSNLTKLVELNLLDCGQLIAIQGLEKLESLQVLNIQGCVSLKILPNISNLKELKVFKAFLCLKLRRIEGLEELISLEHLDLTNCISLKGLGDLSKLNKLQVLIGELGLDTTDFSNFKQLKQLEIGSSNRIEIQSLEGLEALQDLCIYSCSSIERLPNLSYLKRLESLRVSYCDQLVEIQGMDMLESLQFLSIEHCKSLERLPDLPNFGMLKHITVGNLQKVEGLGVIKSLEKLFITDCDLEEILDLRGLNFLKNLSISSPKYLNEIHGLEELKSLEWFSLTSCSSIKALPDLSALQKLKYLNVSCCVKLSEIRGIEELKCLTELSIIGCKGLEWLPDLPNVHIQRVPIPSFESDEETDLDYWNMGTSSGSSSEMGEALSEEE